MIGNAVAGLFSAGAPAAFSVEYLVIAGAGGGANAAGGGGAGGYRTNTFTTILK